MKENTASKKPISVVAGDKRFTYSGLAGTWFDGPGNQIEQDEVMAWLRHHIAEAGELAKRLNAEHQESVRLKETAAIIAALKEMPNRLFFHRIWTYGGDTFRAFRVDKVGRKFVQGFPVLPDGSSSSVSFPVPIEEVVMELPKETA